MTWNQWQSWNRDRWDWLEEVALRRAGGCSGRRPRVYTILPPSDLLNPAESQRAGEPIHGQQRGEETISKGGRKIGIPPASLEKRAL